MPGPIFELGRIKVALMHSRQGLPAPVEPNERGANGVHNLRGEFQDRFQQGLFIFRLAQAMVYINQELEASVGLFQFLVCTFEGLLGLLRFTHTFP